MIPEKPTAPPELVAYLEAHAVPHNIVVPDMPMPATTKARTVKMLKKVAQVIGTDPAAIVQSLLWCAADGAFALVIAGGMAKVDPQKLAAATGRVGWALASPALVREITGYVVGGVPPVGPGYGARFPVLIDRAVMTHPVVFSGGGHEAVLLCLLPRDIVRLTQAEVHDLSA